MKRRRVWAVGTTVLAVVALALAFTSTTSGRAQYEVWAIDQSDSPGKSARFESIARITNVVDGVERADVHASTVRMKTGR